MFKVNTDYESSLKVSLNVMFIFQVKEDDIVSKFLFGPTSTPLVPASTVLPCCFIHICHLCSWVSDYEKMKNPTAPSKLSLNWLPNMQAPEARCFRALASIVTVAKVRLDSGCLRVGFSEGSIQQIWFSFLLITLVGKFPVT